MSLYQKARRTAGNVLRTLGMMQTYALHKPTVKIHKVSLGSDYGGWTFFPDTLSASSIVYSCGVGTDASFDRAVIERYNVSVFAFDPTPQSIEWVSQQKWPSQFTFAPYGIAATDGEALFYSPRKDGLGSHSLLPLGQKSTPAISVQMRRLGTLALTLGHTRIDMLKMDIEGAEYDVIQDILSTSWLTINQILIEFHHYLPQLSADHTNKAVEQLTSAG
jgi:FkbM family methyltransferase